MTDTESHKNYRFLIQCHLLGLLPVHCLHGPLLSIWLSMERTTATVPQQPSRRAILHMPSSCRLLLPPCSRQPTLLPAMARAQVVPLAEVAARPLYGSAQSPAFLLSLALMVAVSG
uniref:Uncharacterized protein n=1 Tax=Aegilops tauschii subsp. strangulata TaxID=200361 RepID=A0A452ZX84_AEGTS